MSKLKIQSSELSQMTLLLLSDCDFCKTKFEELKKRDSVYRRLYIRTLFTLIEGVSHRLRQIILAMHEERRIRLTPSEYMLLTETVVTLDNQGKIDEREATQPFVKMLKFTLKILGKHTKQVAKVNRLLSDAEFKKIIDAVKVRNRLTHPKKLEDLYVAWGEFQDGIDAQKWFENCLSTLLVETFDKINKTKRNVAEFTPNA